MYPFVSSRICQFLLWPLVAVLIAAGVAQAQSTSAPSAKAPKSKSAAKEVPKAPIKVGILVPLSGAFVGLGTDMRDGFLLYVQQKGNQFAGRQINVLVEDSEGKGDVALTKVKKLAERDNIQVLGGVFSSGEAYALADYVKAQKLPFIIGNAGADDLTQRQFSPYIFRNSFSNGQNGFIVGDWAYKKGYRKVSIISSDYAAGYETVGGFAKVFTAAGGRVIQEQYLALGAPDPAPFITSIKPESDVVFAFLSGPDALRFVKNYAEYGLNKKIPLLGNFGLTDDTIIEQEGDAALGIVVGGGYTISLDNPTNKAFLNAFSKKYNRTASLYAEEMYNSAAILDKALQSVKGNIENKDAFLKAIEKVEIPNSTRGPIKLDKYHNIVMDMYIMEVRKVDGKMKSVPLETYKGVSQFWKMNPDEYMKMTPFAKMKGKWAN